MALDLSTPFVWGSGGAQMTPTEIEAQRKVAQAMMAKGGDYSPVQSWTQGAARVAQAMFGGLMAHDANSAAKTNQEAEAQLLTSILGGGAPSASPPGTPSASTPMGSTSIPSGNTEFVNTVMPLAQQASEKTGIDPRLITAQAILETGYGKSAPGNNLFGIKSHGQPGGNVLPTTEVVNGQPVRTSDSFMSYASPADSVNGYADFINANQRYAPLKAARGLEAQADALGRSGYATDPNYGKKVLQIARSLPAPTGGVQADPAALPANSQPTQGFAVPGATPPAASINPALARAIASPYTSEGTKKILSLILTQQMEAAQKANDPLHQLQIQEARSKLTPFDAPFVDDRGNLVQRDALGKVTVLNPADKAPSTVGEYKFYADQETKAGRTPLPFGQWDIARRRSAATNVNTGTIPQGFEQVQDPITGAISMRPIPGGPKDTSKQDQAKAESQATSTDVITNAATNIRDAIKSSNLPATGTAGAALSNIGETGAAEVARQMAVLKSNATIENLNAMRQQSPTGGALGNVTEGEGAMLAAKAGALDMKSPHFMRDLADYERTLLRTIHGKAAGDKIFDATRKPETQPQAPAEGATAVNPQTGERLIRKGGKWVPFT